MNSAIGSFCRHFAGTATSFERLDDDVEVLRGAQ